MNSPTHTSGRVIADSCPLCGASSWTALATGADSEFEWVRCVCTAVFKHSEAAAGADGDRHDVADERHGEAARSLAGGSATGESERSLGDTDPAAHYDPAYFARYARRRRHRIAKSRRQILDALEISPPGRLLDVGCSLGYALEAARSLGLDAAGIDLSAHAVIECRRLGFDAQRGSLDELPFEDASFAIAVLKHVFEHTPTPRRTLAELRRVLIPGAALFLAVPNVDYFKAARSPATARFFRGEAARAHFVYYSVTTLARLLEDEGFRVASVHARLLHRRAPLALRIAEAAMLPVRVPARAIAAALGLRKEFWMVAVRS